MWVSHAREMIGLFMNRIVDLEQTHPTLPFDSRPSPPTRFRPAEPGTGLEHCLFGPLHYEPNYAYPLIVWIHGPDDDERQINKVMPHICLRNYVAISPRGTLETASASSGPRTFSWRQSPDEIVTALDRVLDCVELASARFNIAKDRVFIAGYDAGGTMALRLAMCQPESFAGVASFGGAIPRDHMPLRNLGQVRELPIMIAYGRDSEAYSRSRLCADLKLIHIAGMKTLNIRQYPCGDDLVTQMLKDFNEWVMERVTGSKMDSQTVKFEGLN